MSGKGQPAKPAAKAPLRCPWCARDPRVCWILPCLTLQTALDGKDDAQVHVWAKAVGAKVERKACA